MVFRITECLLDRYLHQENAAEIEGKGRWEEYDGEDD